VELRAVVVTAVGLVLIAGCGGGGGPEVRIFDPSGRTTPAVTNGDFVRPSVRAVRLSGSWVVHVDLNSRGASKFHALTRVLAERGSLLGKAQSFALEVDGPVYSRAIVDYRQYPDGIEVGPEGLEFSNVPTKEAYELAQKLRDS
jgi:hypothetical protein